MHQIINIAIQLKLDLRLAFSRYEIIPETNAIKLTRSTSFPWKTFSQYNSKLLYPTQLICILWESSAYWIKLKIIYTHTCYCVVFLCGAKMEWWHYYVWIFEYFALANSDWTAEYADISWECAALGNRRNVIWWSILVECNLIELWLNLGLV